MKKFVLACLAAASFSALPVAARATVLISNLPPTYVPGTTTGTTINSAASGVQDSKAAGFTLPAGSNYLLTDVILRLQLATTSVPQVAIYGTTAGNPGTLLQTLANPTLTANAVVDLTFTSSSPLTLAAGTTYWVVVSNAATVDDGFSWYASNPAVTPTGIATSAGYRFSNGAPPPYWRFFHV